VGQLFIALAPRATGGENLGERLKGLTALIAEQPGARLPGDKRHHHRRAAMRDGVAVPEALVTQLRGYTTPGVR
jgi:(2R)-3-sulfolactate dehydrogenase (NADP+)